MGSPQRRSFNLREKLREVGAELRAVASLNNVELYVLISFNWQVAVIGLQLRILNWVVSLLTT